MMKRVFLLIFLVLWGLASFGQTNELVGTFSVVSSTGSDPTPTVTGNFNSTAGFLPQNVDTGDVMLVRQVFAGNHRRKLYRITGITGNSPLVLTMTLIEGTTGGPFPAGTQEIFRRTAKGALLDVPNVSQELESYTYNYNVQHFEDADVDTTIIRNDSSFVLLNDGTEFYLGPSTANGISDSYQIGDSIYVVTGMDTIFTGIAYANPEIDTIYNDGTNYYMVTVEGDTIEIGAVAQVVANGAHPTNPPAYLIHIDTLGTDTIYFDNGGVWVRFNVGGSSIGAPLFTALNATLTSFHPAGVPPIGAIIWNPFRGVLMRKYGPVGIFTIGEPNGKNVYVTERYYQADTLDGWNISTHASATFALDVVNGYADDPLGLSSSQRGGSRTMVVTNSSGSPLTVTFSTKYRNTLGTTPLSPITITENSELTLDFTVDVNDTETIMRLSAPLSSGSSYAFQNLANGIDLLESGGTVTVAPNITELVYAAVAAADSVMIWDSSLNAHRRSSVAEIVALASAGTVTVTNLANGLDIFMTGSDITIAPDFGELPNAAVANADSVMVYDVSAAAYRRVSAASIAALFAGSGLTGVTDQANGLDIAAGGGLVTIDYDFDELPTDVTYNGTEQFIFKDLIDGVYKKATTSFLAGGYLDLTTDQTVSAGVKKFAGGLQWGTGTMPTGIPFGSATQTVFGLKGGSTLPLSESAWANYGGLVIENNLVPNTVTTRFIATGDDSGTPDNSVMSFFTRPAGASQNVVENFRLTSAGAFFGNSSGLSSGTAGGVANVPIQGIGWDGGQSLWRLASGQPGGFLLLENGNLNMQVPVGQQTWQPASDIRLKHDTVRLDITPANIRDFKSYTYKWNTSDSATIGVIAQQIEADFPEIVHLMAGTVDTMGVDYYALAAIAYAACEELQRQIDSLSTGRGVDTTASAGNLLIDIETNFANITGSTTTNAIYTTDRRAGSEVTLLFTTGTPTIKHNTSGGAGTAAMLLAGAVDFTPSGPSTLTLIYDGSRWHEKCRSINH